MGRSGGRQRLPLALFQAASASAFLPSALASWSFFDFRYASFICGPTLAAVVASPLSADFTALAPWAPAPAATSLPVLVVLASGR